MTRINAGVQPWELPRPLLLAELREIKRIPNRVRKGVDLNKIPPLFVLGEGHVRFFYNKLGYLLRRYRLLRKEAIRRGYQVSDFSDAWTGQKIEVMQEWIPTMNARLLVVDRIASKGILLNKNFPSP